MPRVEVIGMPRHLVPRGVAPDAALRATPPPRHSLGAGHEDGFTLIELIVVMSIVGVLAAVSSFSFANQMHKRQQQGSTQEIVSFLRSASVQSVSEGRTYCVSLAAAAAPAVNRGYTLWRYSCGGSTSVQVGGARATQTPNVGFALTVSAPASSPCQAGAKCIYFYPRGTATPATVTVSSTKRTKTFAISVEGLTARVY